MSVVLITGSNGLIGAEAVRHFAGLGLTVVGIDNDMRSEFFGSHASTLWVREALERELGKQYMHRNADVRSRSEIDRIFRSYGSAISLVIHAAGQPSHDWAATNPFVDFDVNAGGTLNLLEATRAHAPAATFIFTSTNKVYGDAPNRLPLLELAERWEIESDHTYANGIREDMSIDGCLHSLFGVSKTSADLMVQEYGRYFSMRTTCFRGGTLTGPQHSATELHGFLAYLMRCAMTRTSYTIYGYGGKQVRDAIHSSDVVRAFEHVWREPRVGEVYNIGGGRFSNASVLEAIALVEEVTGEQMQVTYSPKNRIGDHIWWIGDNGKFRLHYPGWSQIYDVPSILQEILEANRDRWTSTSPVGGVV